MWAEEIGDGGAGTLKAELTREMNAFASQYEHGEPICRSATADYGRDWTGNLKARRVVRKRSQRSLRR